MKGEILPNQRGFTLIELLVVISIIGLLASVILVSLSGARKKARDTKRKADIAQVIKSLELYYNYNNTYPNSGAVGTENLGYDLQSLSSLLVPTYLAKIPADPLNSPHNYQYVWNNNGQSYGIRIPFGNDGNLSDCKIRVNGINPPNPNSNDAWWGVADCGY